MITLDSNAYYKLARQAVLDDDFDKALGYFIKAGDYHSQLNAIVLLCFFGDYYLAHNHYLGLLVSSEQTHNVNADLAWAMRGGGEEMLKNLLNKRSRKRDKSKISAHKSKVFQFGYLNADSQLDQLQQDVEQQLLNMDQLQDFPPLPRFTVLGSKQYFDVLTEKMRREFLSGNVSQGTKYAEQLMNSNSDVTSHLELKLMLLLAHNKHTEAYDLAKRLQTATDLSRSGKFVLAEVFMLQGEKDDLHQFLLNTSFDGDLDTLELRKLVALATYVKDYNLAQSYANQMLVDDAPNVDLDYLLTAAIAYYNVGNTAKAISLLKRVNTTLPNNVGVKAVLGYLTNHTQGVAKLNVAYPHRFFTPYQLPSAVANASLQALQEGCDQSLVGWHLSVLVYAENGYYMGTNNTSFGKQIVSFMQCATNLDADCINLMRVGLINEFTSPRLKSAFLYYLTKHHNGDVVVATADGTSLVTNGLFDGVTDAQRLVLCAVAVMHPVSSWDVQKAVQLYNAYDDQMQGQDVFVFAETLFSSLTATS